MESRRIKNILITGGAGFIGSNFIHQTLQRKDFSGRIINLDKLTYAGDEANLQGLPMSELGKRYFFVQGDINDTDLVLKTMQEHDVDTIVHMAAESHVDRSISSPREFIQTNVMGTFNMLNSAKSFWKDREDVLFHHVSTDEVYGSLSEEGFFVEETPYDPRSPYSASKASSDHFARAFFHTYGLPVTISNCSNNYGPRQHNEKLIPLMITNMLEGKQLPVYGKGENVRDWIYVDDHNEALWQILTKGTVGETYNIGGRNEARNIDLVHRLCEIVADKTGKAESEYKSLITHVTDRLGHDFRYAIDSTKIENELSWKNKENFRSGLNKTVDWYLNR